ncbi:hypothetical protein KCTCHS21_22160 [Cohnella abietis]|uniref:Uncharacterized protein n=1 Tax=Cohnella abietis TaxID=2507935 RepID=A0A3T1D3Y4_9BACL|nr:hypothetical protein KCTCHS21_22160 [Cohnella abietis]
MKKEEIVTQLYSINLKDYDNGDVSLIPQYHRGAIAHITQENIHSYHGGHHPWLGDSESYIATEASNLVPDEYKREDGIKIEYLKVFKKSDTLGIATIKFNDDFFYEVKVESSDLTGGIFIITQIDLHTFVKK